MANDDFESFLWRASNYNGGKPEYFEDTHDQYRNYTGGSKKNGGFGYSEQGYPAAQQSKHDHVSKLEQALKKKPKFQYYNVPEQEKNKAAPLPDIDQYISPRFYQNIVLYSPKTVADVQKLIDYIRRREPAIIDLDPIRDDPTALRVLDFVSGATYALKGRISEIRENMFLVIPDGVAFSKPDDDEGDA